MPIALSLPEDIPTSNDNDNDAARGVSFPPIEHFRIKGIPPAAYYVPDFITADEEQYLLDRIAETPRPKWKTVPSGRRLHYWGGNVTKKGVLIPESLPEFLTTFPDIIERLEAFIDFSLGETIPSPDDEHVLGVNQVLVNEYRAGQGISPHEDGPAFRPLVATVSLGSHTVLDIHHYLSTTSPSPPMTASTPPDEEESGGRPIAAIPLAHLLLMPRSLLILSSSLYTSHLHGVTERETDTVTAPTVPAAEVQVEGEVIANADLLGDAEVQDKLLDGGVWSKARGTRTSLTFRHANRVLKGGAFSMAGGRMQRL